jgi:hypothetical protein
VTDPQEQFASLGQSPGMLLAKQAGVHFALWLVTFSLFAATDSWTILTGSGIASFLNLLMGIVAGFVTVTLAHEWSHYLGAKLSRSTYSLSEKPSLFVFDWDFASNNLRQFYTMSAAGSIGGAAGLLALFAAIEPANSGRAALLAGGLASFAFGSIIEWPVLVRTRRSGDPMSELSKLKPATIGGAGTGSALLGLACWLTLA